MKKILDLIKRFVIRFMSSDLMLEKFIAIQMIIFIKMVIGGKEDNRSVLSYVISMLDELKPFLEGKEYFNEVVVNLKLTERFKEEISAEKYFKLIREAKSSTQVKFALSKFIRECEPSLELLPQSKLDEIMKRLVTPSNGAKVYLHCVEMRLISRFLMVISVFTASVVLLVSLAYDDFNWELILLMTLVGILLFSVSSMRIIFPTKVAPTSDNFITGRHRIVVSHKFLFFYATHRCVRPINIFFAEELIGGKSALIFGSSAIVQLLNEVNKLFVKLFDDQVLPSQLQSAFRLRDISFDALNTSSMSDIEEVVSEMYGSMLRTTLFTLRGDSPLPMVVTGDIEYDFKERVPLLDNTKLPALMCLPPKTLEELIMGL